MQNFIFVNTNDGEEVMVEAEGFDHACHLLFGQGDKFDLDYHEWELSEVENIPPGKIDTNYK